MSTVIRRYTSGLHYFLLSTFRQSIVTLNGLEKNIYFDTREEDKVPGYTIHTQAHPVLSKENVPTYGGKREQGKGWSS
jgi:hypothetical protein